MPHYKDGTEAKVGDLVVGGSYNAKSSHGVADGVIVGQVLQITPGTDACNCVVAFARAHKAPVDLDPGKPHPLSEFFRQSGLDREVHYGPHDGIADGSAKPVQAHFLRGHYDYGACKDFTLIHRPGRTEGHEGGESV